MSKVHFTRPQEPRWRPKPGPAKLTERIKSLPPSKLPYDPYEPMERIQAVLREEAMAALKAEMEAKRSDEALCLPAPDYGHWGPR